MKKREFIKRILGVAAIPFVPFVGKSEREPLNLKTTRIPTGNIVSEIQWELNNRWAKIIDAKIMSV